MSLLDSILQNNGGVTRQIGAQLGLDDQQASAALSALVPALAAGLHRNAQSADGLSGLMGALAGGGHQDYLQDPSRIGSTEGINDGNKILGHILGSKDASRAVAAQAASQTGVSADVLKKMLPMVATVVMGALASRSGRTSSIGGGSSPFSGGDLLSTLSATMGSGGGAAILNSLGKLFGR
jgi:hypothetical protein